MLTVGTLSTPVCLCVSIGRRVCFLLELYLSDFDLGLLEAQSRGPIQMNSLWHCEVSTRNGMLHPSCMRLAVQPWPPLQQVEIEELQVPHAYAEDESLWLAQLWCEFIVQPISDPSPIYNPPTKFCVIWSVHLGCLVHVPLYHDCSELVCVTGSGGLFWNGVGSFQMGFCQKGGLACLNVVISLLTLMAIRINARRSANHGRRCARPDSRRSGRQGVMHSLGRHERVLSQNKKVLVLTSGSNRDKSLWGHYCGKSPAMRTHSSNQATKPPTPTSPASRCVDSNSTRMTETRVDGARSAIFC